MSFRVEHLAENVTLYCGRCEDVLPTLGRVDAVVTDPPYGLGNRMQGGTWAAKAELSDMRGWDQATPLDAWIKRLAMMADKVILWGGNYFSLPPSRCWFVWDKANAVPTMSDFEMAWTNLDRPSKRFCGSVGRMEYGHPTSKPEALMSWCLCQARLAPGEVVCDPYLGSGTTGVAAVRSGFSFVGSEVEPKYFDTACRRISDELKRPRLFAEPTPVLRQEALQW